MVRRLQIKNNWVCVPKLVTMLFSTGSVISLSNPAYYPVTGMLR